MAIREERTPRGRQRFSNELEYRRGRRDAEMGRAPASSAAAYRSGYAEARRRQPRKSPRAASGPSG